MKKILVAAVVALLALQVSAQQTISMQQLLRDMVSREKLAEYPSGMPFKAMQASSYNRASVAPNQPGWFADSDGVYCIRTEKNSKGETEWVLMEDSGPGVITKIWAVCFYYGLDNTTGGNINIYLDGAKEPAIHCNFFDFVKGNNFVKAPLAAETRRAGNCYLPIPYAKSCKVTMDKKVFYNIIQYRSYPKGTKVKTFTMDDYRKSVSLVDSVNTVLKQGCTVNNIVRQNIIKWNETLVPRGKKVMRISQSASAVRILTIRLKAKNMAQALRSTVLKASFDGEETIWTPVGDFFNIGVGLKQYRMWERAVEPDGTMICRWVMPYRRTASFTFENLGSEPVEVEAQATIAPYRWTPNSMYFHSTWRMDNPTPGFPLFDYNLVSVKGKGVYVGDQFTVLNPEQGWWGEGDEKVWVDGDKFPSLFGTGTEDYYGWAGGVVPNPVDEFAVPFLSNIRVAAPNSMGYNTCTRTRVLDAIPFNRLLNYNIESSGSNRTSWFHLQYAVNSYWYARPGAVSNRKPLPEMAARKIMTLEELQKYNEKCKSKQYVAPGAIEAENMSTFTTDKEVESLKSISVWGELSNGAVKAYTFTKEGQSVSVRLTEQFAKCPLKICLIGNNDGGLFDIFVNGKHIKDVELKGEYSTSSILDLGVLEPMNNAFEIRFFCKRKGNLAIDYFLIK